MLNYNIPDRKRKVTLQHFDLVWRGTSRGGRRRVCIGEKNPSCPLFFFSRSHCLLFLISVYPVAWQADGSDYTVIINHGRKPWERRRDDREEEGGGEEGEIFWSAHGPAHVSIGPTDQRLCSFPSPWRLRPTSHHQERNRECGLFAKYMQFLSQSCEIFDHSLIRLDSACRWFTLWGLERSLSLKQQNQFSHHLFVVCGRCSVCFFFSFVLRSGSDSSPVSRPVSPQSQCV